MQRLLLGWPLADGAPRSLAYLAAVGFTDLVVVGTFALQAALGRVFGTVFMLIVILTAWLGGLGPGMLASVLRPEILARRRPGRPPRNGQSASAT